MSLALQTFGDLLKRYANAFRYAWARRAELDSVPRQPHEVQFLPAALALQETPVSAAPRVAMWLLIGFAFIVLIWMIFGRIDVMATAHGKIVPNDRIKTIQPMETATVKAIHVSDGQVVQAGEVLIELDATFANADVQRLENELHDTQLLALRDRAFLHAMQGKTPVLSSKPGVPTARLPDAQRLLHSEWLEYRSKLERLDAERASRAASLRTTQTMVDQLAHTAPIARQRAEDYKKLLAQHFISKHGYMERQQAQFEQEGELATQTEKLQEIRTSMQQVDAQKAALIAETRRFILSRLDESEQKIAAATQEIIKARQRGQLLKLAAPVDGTVQQLAIHTVGGVVTPAQPLMIIVPRDNTLEVEAFVENKDIGFIKAGQDAEVKIETFQYTKYGTIHAKVISVSHDAINDEKRGLIYSARVMLDRSTIIVDGSEVNLSPGMAVGVEVKTGNRRVIEYFLSPLLQYGHESLRER
ncbi:MAG: HlyD family type I secretion periplasmic adaptor subunit [Thiobacillaceae bacterium]